MVPAIRRRNFTPRFTPQRAQHIHTLCFYCLVLIPQLKHCLFCSRCSLTWCVRSEREKSKRTRWTTARARIRARRRSSSASFYNSACVGGYEKDNPAKKNLVHILLLLYKSVPSVDHRLLFVRRLQFGVHLSLYHLSVCLLLDMFSKRVNISHKRAPSVIITSIIR